MSRCRLSSSSTARFAALSCGALILALSACDDPSVTPINQNTATSQDMASSDTGLPQADAGSDVGADDPPPFVEEDEHGHGEDSPPGDASDQGAFHGNWTAVVTRVDSPPPAEGEFELNHDDAVGRPFVSFEIVHAADATGGAGTFVMGAASGIGGMSDEFDTVALRPEGATLSWTIGEANKPFTLTTTRRASAERYDATISSDYDPEGLVYHVKLEQTAPTELDIDPDPSE